MRRVVILGRGGAGKSTLARDLSGRTGLPVAELDALFWEPGPTAAEACPWAARHQLVGDRADLTGVNAAPVK
ncbi:MAG TPA: hypothetical protein VG268_01600 [Streptosporangiaceae bacterium]|nr:hypothetical protein [Streptosporangiaceae bacterium]